MTSYRFEVSCQRCGGDVEHVNATPATSVHAVAVCRCVSCDRQWELYLTMTPHAARDNAAKERERKAEVKRRNQPPVSGDPKLVALFLRQMEAV